MQVHFKQTEIELALKLFISQQGINLVNKAISITFTSGRKDNGLSAEMTIEDAVQVSTNTFAEAAKETTEVIKEASQTSTEEAPVKVSSLFN